MREWTNLEMMMVNDRGSSDKRAVEPRDTTKPVKNKKLTIFVCHGLGRSPFKTHNLGHSVSKKKKLQSSSPIWSNQN